MERSETSTKGGGTGFPMARFIVLLCALATIVLLVTGAFLANARLLIAAGTLAVGTILLLLWQISVRLQPALQGIAENGQHLIALSQQALAAKSQQDASEERFRLLVEGVKDYAIFMLDEQGRIASWNAGAERIKGYVAREVIGKHFSLFYTQPDRDRGHPAFELEQATTFGKYEEEGLRVRKDGSTFWANVLITPLFDQMGVLRGFAKVTRDITEKRLAEEERTKLLEELKEAVHARDEFLSIASHELKTPLTSVKLSVEALERHGSGPESIIDAGRVERIRRQIDRLNNLVTSLLEISMITSKRLEFSLEQTDLGTVLQDSLSQFKEELNRAGCALRVKADTNIVGRWDRARLDQVLANLIGNAIKYGPGKPVEVDLSSSGGKARLTVRDHGIGISELDQKRIFARFERAVAVKHYGGFGLGLWITRQIVEGLGGTIVVDSQPGQGSTFSLELPLAGPPLPAEQSPALMPTGARSEERDYKQ